MKVRLVIPSFGEMSSEMQVETGCRFPSLISLGGHPLYYHIIEKLKTCNENYFCNLILPKSAENEFNSSFINNNFNVIFLNKSENIATTILSGLKNLRQGESVLVNMADTIIDFENQIELDTIYSDIKKDLYRWTSVRFNSFGVIEFPQDREQDNCEYLQQEVCVGVFSFSDGLMFREFLKKSIHRNENNVEPFFNAIHDYSKCVKMKIKKVRHWFDCGHVDNYYESRLSFQNLRHFNNLKYNALNGQVTKTSSLVEPFRHQIRWYKQVPDSIIPFIPRIFEISDGEAPFLTMELLSIPTLSDLFVSRRLPLGAWNDVARIISHILTELGRTKFQSNLAPNIAENIYYHKTLTRIQEFEKQDALAKHYKVRYGTKEVSLVNVLDELKFFINLTELSNLQVLSPIHGDFCFSNLLYDPKARLIKMIDPRGEFGVPGIYGDVKYDLAKLAHSFSGGYDFIISDRFSLTVHPGNILEYEVTFDKYHGRVKKIFESILYKDALLYKQVTAIQSLLFLSMLPLHKDKPKRQLAMLATGLKLFEQAKNS